MVSKNSKIVGVFTDGDLRRCLNNKIELNETIIKDVMTSEFKGIASDALAIDAAEMMEKNKIFSLVVNSSTGKNSDSGIITMHHLLEAGDSLKMLKSEKILFIFWISMLDFNDC